MAPEEYVVQSAVRYFFHNWICGLRPSLSLETANDGTLSIHASVQCSPFIQPINSTCDAPRRKQSGRGSRKRRKKQRAFKSSSASSDITSTETTVLEPMIAAEEAVTFNTSNCDSTVLADDFSTEFIDEDQLSFSSDTDRLMKAVITEDLIDFDAPELLIPNRQMFQNDTTAEHFQPPSLPPTGRLCSSEHYELMMYSMVKELYSRTCDQA